MHKLCTNAGLRSALATPDFLNLKLGTWLFSIPDTHFSGRRVLWNLSVTPSVNFCVGIMSSWESGNNRTEYDNKEWNPPRVATIFHISRETNNHLSSDCGALSSELGPLALHNFMILQHLNHRKIYLVLVSTWNIQPYCLISAFSELYTKFYPVAGGVPCKAGCDDCRRHDCTHTRN